VVRNGGAGVDASTVATTTPLATITAISSSGGGGGKWVQWLLCYR